jgi:Putative zinc-finger
MSAPSPHPDDALLDFLYEELPLEEAGRVQAHLADCPQCQRTLEGYREVRRAAASLPREVPAPAGLESLLHEGERAAARARRRRATLWTGGILAAAGLAALLVLGLRPARPPQDSAPLATAAPAPDAVGPLARNEPALGLQKAKKAEDFARREERAPAAASASSRERMATGAAAGARLSRPNALPAAPADRRDEALDKDTALGQPSARASPPAGAAAPPSPSEDAAEASAAVRPAKVAQAEAPASASVQLRAPAPERADDAVAQPGFRVGGKAQRLLHDAGASASPDEERRAVLRTALREAPSEKALPLLAELCALEVKLLHREDAKRVCGQVVAGYPHSPEATAAQQQLDVLPAP